MTAFSSLIPDALRFFDALAANNRRDWFAAHKPAFEAEVKRPSEALLDEMAQWLGRETGAAQRPKLYRIHRDLRFSKDKTPYNTHLHLQWSDQTTGLAHLFGASRAYVCAGVGAMAFSKAGLARWREVVGAEAGEEIADTIAALQSVGHRLDVPALKRVPSPWPQDHPRADLLKRKGLVLWYDLSAAEQTDPLGALQRSFERLTPFRLQLAGALGG